jgi:hypothetical protein
MAAKRKRKAKAPNDRAEAVAQVLRSKASGAPFGCNTSGMIRLAAAFIGADPAALRERVRVLNRK